MKTAGFTHQKLAIFALQRDDSLREQYRADVSLYQRETLLFLDEMGANGRDAVGKYGYSLRGKPLKAPKLLARDNISLVLLPCLFEA